MQRIRKVQIMLFVDSDLCINGLGDRKLDIGIDESALARLTKLNIVAVSSSWYSKNNPYSEKECKMWLEWVERIVKQCKSASSSTLCLELDNDGEETTTAIATRYFPKRLRNVKTECGGFFFCRKPGWTFVIRWFC